MAVVADLDGLSPESQRFLALTNDRTQGVALDLSSDADVLLVAFGGMAGHMGMPPFEFFRVSQALDVKKAYVRDLESGWYHLGVPGLGDGIEEVAERLRALVADAGAERVVFAGNSAGGFAAILFGALVGADAVLSFSPQSLLRIPELEAAGDDRWTGRLTRAAKRRGGSLDPRFEDLCEVVRETPMKDGARIDVHYCSRLSVDAFHAERLAALPALHLHDHPRGGHGVIRALRTTGELAALLDDATAGRLSDDRLVDAVLDDVLLAGGDDELDDDTIDGPLLDVLPVDDDWDETHPDDAVDL